MSKRRKRNEKVGGKWSRAAGCQAQTDKKKEKRKDDEAFCKNVYSLGITCFIRNEHREFWYASFNKTILYKSHGSVHGR